MKLKKDLSKSFELYYKHSGLRILIIQGIKWNL